MAEMGGAIIIFTILCLAVGGFMYAAGHSAGYWRGRYDQTNGVTPPSYRKLSNKDDEDEDDDNSN